MNREKKESSMMKTGAYGTDFWNDSCDVNELEDALSHGAVGATSNPVIVCKVIKKYFDVYGPVIDDIVSKNPTFSEIEITWKTIEKVVIESAQKLENVYNKHKGKKGRLSVQVNPIYYRNPENMITHGLYLSKLAPNLAIKLPATDAGITAAEKLTAQGVSVMATVSFTAAQAVTVAEAIERGLKEAERNGIDTSAMAPTVVLMVGRLDDHLKRVMKEKEIVVDPGILEWAGIAVFKKTYSLFKERGYNSRLLSAAYRNHMQWSQLIGGDVILTIPYDDWKRFNNSSIEVCPRIEDPVDSSIVQELKDNFEDFGKAYDEKSLLRSEFEYFGSSVHTLNQFIEGYYELLSFVRKRMFRR